MINLAQILGRVGKIDTKTTANGIKICNMSMVTSKKYMKDGQKLEKVTWHNVTMFSKLAEVAEQYVCVGDLLYIQGEMDNDKYVDKNGQEKRKSFIIAHELKLMPKYKENYSPKNPAIHQSFTVEDDEIPF